MQGSNVIVLQTAKTRQTAQDMSDIEVLLTELIERHKTNGACRMTAMTLLLLVGDKPVRKSDQIAIMFEELARQFRP